MSPLSVVVPTYNGAAFIEQALRSVFGQTCPPLEIIVVDDASTDGTAQVVSALGRESPVPLRLIALPRNSGGPAGPLNVGIEAARGDLIAVLDQDDVFVPDRLLRLGRAIEARPGVAFAFSACGPFEGPVTPGRLCQPPWLRRRLLALGEQADGCVLLDGLTVAALLLSYGNFVVGYPGFVFRRRDWQQKGGIDETLRVSSDFDLLCWLCFRGRAAFVPRALYLRRLHGGNVTMSGPGGTSDGARLVLRYLTRQPALVNHRIIRRHLRSHFAELLASLGSSGAAPPPLHLLCSAARLWGWDRALLRAGLHIAAGATLRRLGRRSRIAPPEAAELRQNLGAILGLLRDASRPRQDGKGLVRAT